MSIPDMYPQKMAGRVQLLRHHLRGVARGHRGSDLRQRGEVGAGTRNEPRRERGVVGLVRVGGQAGVDRVRPDVRAGGAARVHVDESAIHQVRCSSVPNAIVSVGAGTNHPV